MWFFQVIISLGKGGLITTHDNDNYAAYNFLYLFCQKKKKTSILIV